MATLILHEGELYHAEDFSDDYLAHYGVKGMKWGVRRARARVSNAYGRARSGAANAYGRARAGAGKVFTKKNMKRAAIAGAAAAGTAAAVYGARQGRSAYRQGVSRNRAIQIGLSAAPGLVGSTARGAGRATAAGARRGVAGARGLAGRGVAGARNVASRIPGKEYGIVAGRRVRSAGARGVAGARGLAGRGVAGARRAGAAVSNASPRSAVRAGVAGARRAASEARKNVTIARTDYNLSRGYGLNVRDAARGAVATSRNSARRRRKG